MTTDAELAEELRVLAATLHQTSAAPSARDRALASLQTARAALAEGVPRLRWYEASDGPADGVRSRNRDLSAWSGSVNAAAPPMRLEVGERHGEPAMIGHVRLDRMREGPPGCVHGGVIAGLFDELMGAGQRLSGREGGMTGRLVVRYRRPTPLDTDLVLRAWVTDDRPTRVMLRAECLLADTVNGPRPTVTAGAEAFFVRPRA